MARAIVVLLALWLGALVQAQEYRPFCQVRCGDGSVGSGTLVDENEGRGLVITNHHVIRGVLGARGKITCWFTSTDERMEASILKADSRYDLAALVVNTPNVKPIQLAAYTGEGRYFVWGYPHAGPLRYVTGLIASDNRSVFRPGDYYVAELTAPVYSGMSGGAVVNARGEMVGVVWGTTSTCGMMTCGKPFDEFLVSLTQCGGGSCWVPSQRFRPGGQPIQSAPPRTAPQPPPVQQPPVAPSDKSAQCPCDEKWNKLESRLAEIEKKISVPTIDVKAAIDAAIESSNTKMIQAMDQRMMSVLKQQAPRDEAAVGRKLYLKVTPLEGKP